MKKRFYSIYFHGDHYELWVDHIYIGDFRTYIEALEEADRRGAEKMPRKADVDDSDAPF